MAFAAQTYTPSGVNAVMCLVTLVLAKLVLNFGLRLRFALHCEDSKVSSFRLQSGRMLGSAPLRPAKRVCAHGALDDLAERRKAHQCH